MKRTLMIDNTRDLPQTPSVGLSHDFRSFFIGETEVRRAPERDLPADLSKYSHIVLSGSRTSILDDSPWVRELMAFVEKAAEKKIPMLGICYGHQIIAKTFGAKVGKSPTPEIGWVEIRQSSANPVLEGLKEKFYSYQSHFEEVSALPKRFRVTAENERCAIQAYYVEDAPIYGIQFHPEKSLEDGLKGMKGHKAKGIKDCIFNESRAKALASDAVAKTIFGNFLKIK